MQPLHAPPSTTYSKTTLESITVNRENIVAEKDFRCSMATSVHGTDIFFRRDPSIIVKCAWVLSLWWEKVIQPYPLLYPWQGNLHIWKISLCNLKYKHTLLPGKYGLPPECPIPKMAMPSARFQNGGSQLFATCLKWRHNPSPNRVLTPTLRTGKLYWEIDSQRPDSRNSK